jgi:cytochrome P450
MSPAPSLAMPEPPPADMGLFEFITRVRENAVSIYPPAAFERRVTRRRVGFTNFMLFNDPDSIQHILLGNQSNYPKGRLNRQILGPALGDGLLTSEGETWRRHRRIAAPAFHHRRLAELAAIMVEETLRLRTRWDDIAGGGPVDMSKEMMTLTMRIVTRCLFSHDVSDDVDELGGAITTMIETLGKTSMLDLLGLPEWLPRHRDGELRRAMKLIDDRIYRIIAERRASQRDYGDLLDLLLKSRDEETGECMSDRELRDEVVTLFAAGHETTAVALAWTWYLLSLHPEVAGRLAGEVTDVLGERPPAFSDLERLPYTRMVFEETMRLYPPAFVINRVALADDRIGDVDVPAGTMVSVSPWITHRNPNLWDEPERFDPERFTEESVRARHKYAYFPFGGGPRICIGNGFALMEGRLVLAALAPWFAPRLAGNEPVVPQGRITLRPRGGLPMVVEHRPIEA